MFPAIFFFMLNYREGLDGFLLIFLSQISCVLPMVGLDFSPKKVIYRVRENIMKFILYTQKDPPLTNSICSLDVKILLQA